MSRGDGSVGDRPAKRRRGSPSAFVVVVDGREFRMSQTMLEHDAPNYFTAMFNGDWSETSNERVDLGPDHDAELFQLMSIICGYAILPLDRQACPRTMTVEVALRNLLLMATYFDLEGLESVLRNALGLPDSTSIAISASTAEHRRPYTPEEIQAIRLLPVREAACRWSVAQCRGSCPIGRIETVFEPATGSSSLLQTDYWEAYKDLFSLPGMPPMMAAAEVIEAVTDVMPGSKPAFTADERYIMSNLKFRETGAKSRQAPE